MSINRSEQFVYFQNKAKHYENIKKMKPAVHDKLEQSYYRHTIDHSPQKRRKANPYLKEHEIKVQNDNLVKRLMNIRNSHRCQVSVTGPYSRYNNNERSFRSRNPYRDEFNRKVQEQNSGFVMKLSKTKPRVGLTSLWQDDFQDKVKHKKILSKFDQTQRSKGSLHIDKTNFIPEPYRIYLNDSLDKSIDGKPVVKIPKEDLIKFPKIMKQNRSKSDLNDLTSNRSQQSLDLKFNKQ